MPRKPGKSVGAFVKQLAAGEILSFCVDTEAERVQAHVAARRAGVKIATRRSASAGAIVVELRENT